MMNAQQKLDIKKRIVNAATYYNKPMNTEIVEMYMNVLQGFDYGEVCDAINRYAMKGKFMFTVADLVAIMRPEPDEDAIAREVASKITKAITKFGWSNSSDAREFIGELGWKVVERKGGWNYICQNHGHILDSTTFEAQSRELVKTEIKSTNNPYYKQMLESVSSGMSLNEAIKKSEGTIEERKKILLDQAKKLEEKS